MVLVTSACKREPDRKPAEKRSAPDKTASAPAKPAAEPTCDEVADHFADYLVGRRGDDMWRDAREINLQMCTESQFTAEEKRCWMQIHDVASHQACLDLREKAGKKFAFPKDPDDEELDFDDEPADAQLPR